MNFRAGLKRAGFLLAVLTVLTKSLPAQTPPTAVVDILKLPRTQRIVISRLSGPITLDGRSDEPAWQAVPPICLVMQ